MRERERNEEQNSSKKKDWTTLVIFVLYITQPMHYGNQNHSVIANAVCELTFSAIITKAHSHPSRSGIKSCIYSVSSLIFILFLHISLKNERSKASPG